jgi:hypothetical protein
MQIDGQLLEEVRVDELSQRTSRIIRPRLAATDPDSALSGAARDAPGT